MLTIWFGSATIRPENGPDSKVRRAAKPEPDAICSGGIAWSDTVRLGSALGSVCRQAGITEVAWKDAVEDRKDVQLLECSLDDLRRSWTYFFRRDLHKLSAVDATSFAIMKRKKIGAAFAFDHHFAAVGFRLIG